ncbi:MAG TPA: alpha-mannosidase, partial [Bacteroidales bacterium]|nr:alpha-mannosidase [Bacteroidales bacterium]
MKKMISIIIFICSGIFSGIVFSQPVKVTDETFLLLKKVSESVCSKGEIILSVTTHQDMGWIDEVEKCIIMRDTLWMTPYLERLRYDPEFCMDIEQVSIIVEYLNRHPDKKEEIQKGLDEGRILVGATFTQPYEDMYSGESLIRQFYLGKKWLKQNFNGFNSDTYFNADVPGRTLQMAQILARAGVSNMLATRHEKGLFDWYSPDGSKVTMYSSGHYIDFYNILKKKNEEALAGMAREVLFWGNYYDTNSEKIVIPAHLNYEFIWDQEPVRNCDPFISLWNSVRVVENQNGERLAVKLPPFRYGNLNDCMNIMRANASTVEKIEGERPSLWLYIHGPSHHYAITASRNADILLPDAEKFSAIDAMLGGNFRQYDQDRFNEAWQAKIYPDHGWGGKGGESTDAIFLARFEKSLSDARSIANQALISIASKIKANRKKGIPVVVFNSLSWKRDDPVTFNIGFDPGQAFDITLVDADGKNIPVQLTDIERYSDKSLKNTNATFIAKGIPPIGYKTFYVVPGNTVPDVKKPGNNNYETLFYKIVLGKGGVKSIFDKELNIELLNCKNIFVGDIFTMKSVGNGAAEFADIQQPEMEGFDKVSNHSPGWEIEETGPVFTSFKMRQPIRNAVAETHLIIYNNLKKIDFKTALLNWEGVLYREYRFAMPLNMKNGKVAYEVPFGVL